MRIFGLPVLLLLFSSCDFNTDSEADRMTNFALAAVKDNILTTDFTALVEVTRVSAEGFTENDDEGLVPVTYTAKVLEIYLGEERRNIVFTEFVERGEGLEGLSRGVLIVSLCKDRDGNFYLPDIGYELPAQDVLVEKSREIKTLIDKKKLPLRNDHDNYACDSH